MKHLKLFYGSSYDRGLIHLLKIWSQIKDKHPQAELHIAYGWDLFDRAFQNNPERQNWKERVNKLMEQPGITHHGRVGKDKLQKIRKECGIWAYPTEFTEINCITALEAQRDGCVPVVMAVAALKETVGSGIKLEGDIYDPEIRKQYLAELLKLMGNKELWSTEVHKAKEFAKSYDWSLIAKQWEAVFS